mgnify:CR=1 FL=1
MSTPSLRALFKEAARKYNQNEITLKSFVRMYAQKKGIKLSQNNFRTIMESTNKIKGLRNKQLHVIKMIRNKKGPHTQESIKRRTSPSPQKRKRITSYTPEKSWIAKSLQN